MNARFAPLAAVLLAGLVVAPGCHSSRAAPPEESSSTAARPRVRTGRPARETLRLTTSQPGTIEAFEATPVYPRIAGYVDEVPVDIGDRVRKEDVLVRIGVPDLLDELAQKAALRDQAAAEVQQSAAAKGAVEAALATARAKIREAEAGIARADADHERWKAEHARISELASGGSVTRRLVDESLNSLRSADAAKKEAAARAESAEAAVREAEANVEKARADVAAAEARLKVAEANHARTRTLVGYLDVKAPFDGCVTKRSVDTGHYVQPASGSGARPLLVVARTDRIRIFVDVPETEARYADRGDKASVVVQALGGERIEGTVARTSWGLDSANRSLRVEVDVGNAEGRLRPGMFATAEILLAESVDALTVPASAISRVGDAAYVWSVRGRKVARTPVRLGVRSGKRVEVLEGLSADETIVISDAAALKEGLEVDAVDAEAP